MSEAKQPLADVFAAGRAERRALVMPFLVCGYPDADRFVACAVAAAEAGADVLEIGIPFSDPIMDGPVIAAASNDVLAKGQTVGDALELITEVSRRASIPMVGMTYYNIIYRFGPTTFAEQLAARGGCGVIVPDLSVEDAEPWREACAAAGIAPVFMAAQTSPDDRLRAIGAAADGFVYAASLLGVTGLREGVNQRARELVERIKTVCDLPVAVGIGVSTAEHAHEVAAYADGVIVGTAVVKRIAEAQDPAAAVGSFVAELRAAVAR